MTPARNRVARNLTAAVFAALAVSLFLLGVDGLLGAMQRLTRLMGSAPPPAVAPAAEVATTPDVVPAFIVPVEEPRPGEPAASEHK